MNWIPYYSKYLSWLGLIILFLWVLFYWLDIPNYKEIDKPMAIIGIICNLLGNVMEQMNKK